MAGLICNSAANARKVDYEGVRSVATAAKAAGVKHYVQVSSLGVTNDRPLCGRGWPACRARRVASVASCAADGPR